MLDLAMVLLTAQVMAFPTDLPKVQVWELASALVMASLTGQEMDQMMVLLMVLELVHMLELLGYRKSCYFPNTSLFPKPQSPYHPREPMMSTNMNA